MSTLIVTARSGKDRSCRRKLSRADMRQARQTWMQVFHTVLRSRHRRCRWQNPAALRMARTLLAPKRATSEAPGIIDHRDFDRVEGRPEQLAQTSWWMMTGPTRVPGHSSDYARAAGRAGRFRLAARREARNFSHRFPGQTAVRDHEFRRSLSSAQVLLWQPARAISSTSPNHGSSANPHCTAASCILMSHRMMTLMPKCF